MKNSKIQKQANVLLLCFVLGWQINLIAQSCSSIYGVKPDGGIDNQGHIFHLDPFTGAQINDFSFPEVSGKQPNGNLTNGGNGKFYGMTFEGGRFNRGVIFEWDPKTNHYLKIFNFDGESGMHPLGSLTFYNGKLYGMTHEGGLFDKGVIFELDPVTNTCLKKIDFDYLEKGANPCGSLIMKDGKFYGMTSKGGANLECGVIFEWDPATNEYIKKLDFGCDAMGGNPHGSLSFFDGRFFGMTTYGGLYSSGVIFEWDPASNYFIKKIDFDGILKGSYPYYGSLTLHDGEFYGMTNKGGKNNNGVIFKWDPYGNNFSKILDFNNTTFGGEPYGSLILNNGKFYGMTAAGGATGDGVIFEWNPLSNDFITKVEFNSIATGKSPHGDLTLLGDKFFGLTCNGGVSDNGVIFEWDPVTSMIQKKIDFFPDAARYPYRLTYGNGKLYGLTLEGGNYNSGVIFEWDPESKTYGKLADLDGLPYFGSLTFLNGMLYGITYGGGDNIAGMIFECNPVTKSIVKKIDFDCYPKGCRPTHALVSLNGKFYGTTPEGGNNFYGVIFEWDPETNAFIKKIDFDGDLHGSNPLCNLEFGENSFFGTTCHGGDYGCGVIFEWDYINNIISTRIHLSDTANPPYPGSLIKYGEKFYGTTYNGGSYDYGVIFEFDPNTNVYLKKIDFDGVARGKHPLDILTLFNGKLYGMTIYGGNNNLGTIFEWNPLTNAFIKLIDFDVNGPYRTMIALTVYPALAPTVWTGIMDSDWFNAGNWNPCIPQVRSDVTIPQVTTNYPTLTLPASCASINLENSASFIGSEYLTTNNAIVTRNFPSDSGYHYISSPVTATEFNEVFPNNQDQVWAYRYDEPTGDWINQRFDSILQVGYGYSVRTNSHQIAKFTGQLNSNPVFIPLSHLNTVGNTNRAGWNLVGNPFTSALSWDSIQRGPGVDGAVYVWNGSNYISFVSGVGGLIGGIIPPQNGFFVKTNTNNESLCIPLSARKHSNIPFYKGRQAMLLSLIADGNGYSDEAFVYFNENATSGFDTDFDSYKLMGILEAPQLYSIVDENLFNINSLPPKENEVVDMGFGCGVSGSYSITVDGLDSFNAFTPICLEDLRTGKMQNLRSNPVYNFNYNAGEDEYRFRLHFKANNEYTVISGINIYSALQSIVITNPSKLEGEVLVFDLLGRAILSAKMTDDLETRIPVEFALGTYIVKVITEKEVISSKVLIR